jgi:hypothetical protein
MEKEKITTIRVLESTKYQLGEYGKKNETYDEIIQRIVKEVLNEKK